jgi:hypothetical protein
MDSENVSTFFGGFFTAVIISIILMVIFVVPFPTSTARETMDRIQQSTNIVEALKKEHLVIRDVDWGKEDDTVEIIVKYDFLYKNSKMR